MTRASCDTGCSVLTVNFHEIQYVTRERIYVNVNYCFTGPIVKEILKTQIQTPNFGAWVAHLV